MSSSDYLVQIKVRNGPMARAMRRAGFATAAELARKAGASNGTVGDYLGLKLAPIDKNGDWRPSIMRIAQALRTMPIDLFPPQHLDRALSHNTAEVEMSLDDLAALPGSAMRLLENPESAAQQQDVINALRAGLESLTPREREVIERRFGLSGPGETLEEIGKTFRVTRDRIRQIEAKALRKLKHPSASAAIIDAGYMRSR